MKYKVTEKHPAYKEGLEIINNSLILPGTDDWGEIYNETITDWLKEGWIEEIQKPQFTEKDMLNFGKYCDTGYRGAKKIYKKALNIWIKKSKDENKNK